MNDPRPVKQVINEVLLELSRLNYSKGTIRTYAFCYKRLVKFMDLRGILFYEEQVCLDYLQWRHDIKLTSLLYEADVRVLVRGKAGAEVEFGNALYLAEQRYNQKLWTGSKKKAYPSVNTNQIINRMGGYAYGESYSRAKELYRVTAVECVRRDSSRRSEEDAAAGIGA